MAASSAALSLLSKRERGKERANMVCTAIMSPTATCSGISVVVGAVGAGAAVEVAAVKDYKRCDIMARMLAYPSERTNTHTKHKDPPPARTWHGTTSSLNTTSPLFGSTS